MPEPAVPVPPARSGGVRRTLSQAGLVAALWAVFSVCATAAGACSLLVTVGNDRALSGAIAQADGSPNSGSPDITTVVVASANALAAGAAPADAAMLVPLTREALVEAAAPYRAEVSVWTTTPMLFLAGTEPRRGYLLDADTVEAHASLLLGDWPTSAAPAAGGRIPVAIPSTTAAALGAGIGTGMRLSEERQHGDAEPPGFSLVVAGIFEPSGMSAWTRDTLRGQGYRPEYEWLPAYGPFVVAPGTLERLAAPVDTVGAVMDPDLAGDAKGIPALLHGVQGVADRIQAEAGAAIRPVLVRSALGAAFDQMRAELSLSNSMVLAVLLLVLALGTVTAALVARVLAVRRAGQAALLRDRGASTWQLTLAAAAESAALAIAAVLVAAPLAVAGYRALSAAPAGASWPAAGSPAPELSPTVALALLLGALLPAAVVVLAALPERARRGRQVITGPVARSGIDVMVAVVAAVTYLQLRSHVVSPGVVDPLLVLAPAACAIAVAALATRSLPFLLRAANTVAGRSRGVVVPVAGWHLARGGAAHGAFLLVLAAAVGTLGVTFLSTWSVSQSDQAEAMTGADLVVAQAGGPGTAASLTQLTGGTATPVVDRAVVLGTRPEGVIAVALDAALADRVLRGRLPDGSSWSSAMADLAPQDGGAPLVIDGGPFQLTVTGGLAEASLGAGPAPVVTATPTLVLVDESGYTTTLSGAEAALDGRPHTMRLPTPGQQGLPPGRWRIVAIDLLLADHTVVDLISWGTSTARMEVSVLVEGASSGGGAWDAAPDPGEGGIRSADVAVHEGTVAAGFSYSVLGLSWQDTHLRLLSFPASTQVPVVMTARLATELGLVPGDRMALTWATTPVEAVLVRTVPYVPAHVRDAAVLADATALGRALLSAGMVGPVTDAWWVSSPREGAAEAVRAAGGGPVSTVSETTTELLDGPLRAPLRVGWLLAIGAAVGLAVTGSAAHAAAEALQRGTTIARLRALGVSRRAALASHLLQHAAVTATAVLLGTASGAILAGLLAPHLVVAPGGQPAVPAVELVWSGAPTALVVGAILVGALLVGVPAGIAVARRSTVAALRAGDAL